MPTVTLLAKVYNNLRLHDFRRSLTSRLEGLKVEAKTCGVTDSGWVQVSISGEDETAALHYLQDRIGLCPARLEDIGRFSTMRGRMANPEESLSEIRVDIGAPSNIPGVIRLPCLQAQLVDGRKASMKKIVELFALCENLPFAVKIHDVDRDKGFFEAEVAEMQRRAYVKWTESLLDRLLVLGASLNSVRLAVERTGLGRDVVDVEPLGEFEHAITCKLGTDAVGLIPRIGKNLRSASLAVFSPRRILAFLENERHQSATSDFDSVKSID